MRPDQERHRGAQGQATGGLDQRRPIEQACTRRHMGRPRERSQGEGMPQDCSEARQEGLEAEDVAGIPCDGGHRFVYCCHCFRAIRTKIITSANFRRRCYTSCLRKATPRSRSCLLRDWPTTVMAATTRTSPSSTSWTTVSMRSATLSMAPGRGQTAVRHHWDLRGYEGARG